MNGIKIVILQMKINYWISKSWLVMCDLYKDIGYKIHIATCSLLNANILSKGNI